MNIQGEDKQDAQLLRCWEGYDSKGANITVSDKLPDLAISFENKNFNDRIASCCFSGG